MFKYKITLIVLLTAFVGALGYCQGKAENRQVKSIAGTVINVDAVGNIITIQTAGQKQMAFSVLDKANITQETHDIGLMDIRTSDPVIVQYYLSLSGKYIVVSIMDSKPTIP